MTKKNNNYIDRASERYNEITTKTVMNIANTEKPHTVHYRPEILSEHQINTEKTIQYLEEQIRKRKEQKKGR